MINGMIVQKWTENEYQGIEGDNWFLRNDSELDDYVDKYVDRSWEEESLWVDVCNEYDFILKYAREARKQGVLFRILLCESEIQQPQMELPPTVQLQFIGFDIAEINSGFYSSINSDLINHRIDSLKGHKINEYGLFQTHEEASMYQKERNTLFKQYDGIVAASDSQYLEKGEFYILKIYEVKINNGGNLEGGKE